MASGQTSSQVSFAGVPTAWTYDNLSEILTSTVGSGALAQTTTNTWDALGRKTAVQDANGTTHMAFDLAGRMTSLTDPDQNQTVWSRDNLGRVTAEQNPSGTETFSYDSNSNLTQQVDFDGRERDFVFDDLNRETAEKWMNGGTAFNIISTAYNADGQVTSTGDDYSDYAFGYNGQGDQTSVDNAGTPNSPDVVLTSGYDAQGNRTSLAATINGTADFLNNYSYDALSRLRDITQQGQSGGNAVAPKEVDLSYNSVGQLTKTADYDFIGVGPRTDSATSAYSYDTRDLLSGIDDTANGGRISIDNLAYTYDTLARVSTFTSIDGTVTYGYDHTSQLVSASYTTATGGHQPNNVSFTWDANGNNAAPGNVVSANNEVTNDGTFTYTFDADGNRTSKTRISSAYATDYKTTYSWDYRNRLTDVEFYDNNNVLTKHVHLVYDVYDNLIEEDIDPTGGGSYTTKEQFALDVKARVPTAGNAPLEAFDASGNLVPSLPDDVLLELVNGQLSERFLNGPSPSGAADVIYAEGAVNSLMQPDVPDWLLVNNQGSPTDVTNSSGTLIDHQVYSAFGQLIYVSSAGVFVLQGFSGGFADPNTGLVKFGERWYDPTATVWISVDPARFRTGDANPDRYAKNMAPNAVDPTGLIMYEGPFFDPMPPGTGWVYNGGTGPTLGAILGNNPGVGQPLFNPFTGACITGAFSSSGPNSASSTLAATGPNVCNTTGNGTQGGTLTATLQGYPPGTYIVTVTYVIVITTTNVNGMPVHATVTGPNGDQIATYNTGANNTIVVLNTITVPVTVPPNGGTPSVITIMPVIGGAGCGSAAYTGTINVLTVAPAPPPRNHFPGAGGGF